MRLRIENQSSAALKYHHNLLIQHSRSFAYFSDFENEWGAFKKKKKRVGLGNRLHRGAYLSVPTCQREEFNPALAARAGQGQQIFPASSFPENGEESRLP